MDTDAFKKGREDSFNDYGRDKNPFAFHPKHWIWQAGWDSADKDLEQAKKNLTEE